MVLANDVVRINNAESSKKFAMALKPFSAPDLISALGALGRKFEYCLPDSNKKTSHTTKLPRLSFLFLTHSFRFSVAKSIACRITLI